MVELNVQNDHVHLIADVAKKFSISNFVGQLKGQTATKMFNECRQEEALVGIHFWSKGYYEDTVGLDSETVLDS